MNDIFENTVLCKKCQIKMKKVSLVRNGFETRALVCPTCGNKILHPEDEKEFEQFNHLKNKTFRVKMRVVGNSYAVSIPKEIVNFMHEQEKIMNDMVRLCFNDAKKLSLMFGESLAEDEDDDDEKDVREIARQKIKNSKSNVQ